MIEEYKVLEEPLTAAESEPAAVSAPAPVYAYTEVDRFIIDSRERKHGYPLCYEALRRMGITANKNTFFNAMDVLNYIVANIPGHTDLPCWPLHTNEVVYRFKRLSQCGLVEVIGDSHLCCFRVLDTDKAWDRTVADVFRKSIHSDV